MLTEVQLMVIAVVASLIVWLLKLAKADASSGWLTVAVYGVSLALAWVFAPLALPPLPACGEISTCVIDVVAWVGELLVPISAFVGFATLIYNTLLKSILEKYVRPIFSK